jgi:putative DNA primase/helicase
MSLSEFAGIPQELRELRQWVAWWSVAGQGKPVEMPNGRLTRVLEPRPKPHKLPVNPATGGLAAANRSATWNTFEGACRAVERFGLTGVGFVFSAEDPYTGIDLDDCLNPQTGELAPWARRIVDELDSYAEVSPSGKGVKLIVRAPLPGGRGRRRKLESGEIEMYTRERYFALTGLLLPGARPTVEDRGEALAALYDRAFAETARPDPRPPSPDPRTAPSRLDRLWAGDTSLYGGDDSRADLALCRALARQTGGDRAQIDSLFRQSGLYREKWERADYRDRTIDLAIAGLNRPAKPATGITDVGNAERLVARHAGSLRYCPELRSWVAWDGRRWVLDAGGYAVECAKETVRSIRAEALAAPDAAQRASLTKWAGLSESAARILGLVRMAESDPRLRVSPGELDQDPYLLNCANGVVDLRTGELHPHDPGLLVTRLAPVEYDPAARAPRWLRFLDAVFDGNAEVIGFLQRAAGYSLTGDTREECLFLLWGAGRNGKGTFLRTLMEMLGDYAVTADFSTFTSQQERGGPRDDVAHMRGRHFVTAQEGREGGALAESLIKWLTGGDRVRARRLYENSYEFLPTHKIWLATNYKPVVRGGDPAIWSRIKLVPFEVSFEGREDRGLKEALRAELPGVLAWAVEGCLRWQEDGMCFPETVRGATAAWRNENDQVGRFLDECCVRGEFCTVRSRTLYGEYRRWSGEAGEEPMGEKPFCQRVMAAGFERKKREDGNWYVGIGLRLEDGR